MKKDPYFTWTERSFDLSQVFDKTEALKGIRILEVATLILGPGTPDYLGEFGAEVIKVELPPSGDTMRYVPPQGIFWKNGCPGFFPQNRNKYHLGIDLHKPEGKDLFKKLAAKSDVLVENLRAGTMDRWGLGWRQLSEINPRLIYCANNGFGQWGPFSVGRASYDVLAQAVSGMASITGFPGRPPQKVGFYVGDYMGALFGAIAVLAALHYRERTGKGQFIEFAQSEGLIRSMDWTWLFQHFTGKERGQYGNRDVAICPSDIFPCKDGHVAIAAASDEEFRGLCQAMGRPELASDPRFKDPMERLKEENARELLQIIRQWAATKTEEELDRLGEKHGFASAPVMDFKDLYEDEHLRARGSVWELDDPLYGKVVECGPVPKLSKTPGRLKWSAKPVGFHNEYVLRKLLGFSTGEIKKLREKGVIGRWADRPGAKPPDDWKEGEGQVF
ncbi:MAG: CoA transferase [candidate division NC10 bacterium]|nr:CoA transferase [candidate division NC10 bacterium]